MVKGPEQLLQSATRRLRPATACFPAESVVCTVIVYVPDVVGIPEIVPDVVARLVPGGRRPVMIDHVYGALPPVAAKTAL
jgi:hypothetical protein